MGLVCPLLECNLKARGAEGRAVLARCNESQAPVRSGAAEAGRQAEAAKGSFGCLRFVRKDCTSRNAGEKEIRLDRMQLFKNIALLAYMFTFSFARYEQ